MSDKLEYTLATLPGKSKRLNGTVYIHETQQNMDYIINRHPNIQMDGYLRSKYVISFDDEESQAIPDFAKDYVFHTQPYNHQKKDFYRFCDANFYALFYEMGAGKTKLVIDLTAVKYLAGDVNTLIVIAPGGVHRQWAEEQIPKHLQPDIQRMCHVSSAREYRKGIDNFEEVLAFEGLAVFCFHYQSVSLEDGPVRDLINRVIRTRKKVKVVFDESTAIKNEKSNITEYMQSLTSRTVCRAILDGTPVTKNLFDVFSPFKFLSPTVFGDNYYAYRAQYAVMGGYKNKKIKAYKNLDEVQNKIDRYGSRVLKKDCMDLPEKIIDYTFTELTQQQLDTYSLLKEQFVIDMSEGKIQDVVRAANRIQILQAILSGFIPNPEDKPKRIESNRATTMVEWLRMNEKKTIIWAKYHEEIAIISETLARSFNEGFVVYSGLQNDDQKQANLKRFKTDPGTRFIIGSKSMDRGLDIVEGKRAFWYSPTYMLDQYLQANDRIHRGGQTESVHITRCTAGGKYVDQQAWDTLEMRKNFATELLDVRNSFL